MSAERKIVGFDRKIELEWLDATAAQVAHGAGREDVRAFLWKMLEGSVSAGSLGFNSDRGKTITVLAHVWSEVPEGVEALRERALKLIQEVDPGHRIAVHWAMCMATYPFFRDVASTVGRMTALQDRIAIAEIRRRLSEQWGDRDITRRASQRIIRSFIAWGVLDDSDKRGTYERASKRLAVGGAVAEALVEGLLMSLERHIVPAAQLASHPAIFPFDVKLSLAELRRAPRFIVEREGLDGEVIGLARP